MTLPATAHRVAPAAAAIALLLAGCIGAPPQGDPGAPVLIRGQVLDATGGPLGGAVLSLTVKDFANVEVGDAVAVLFNADFVAGGDGRFEIHLAIDPGLSEVAASNGGFVNFDLTVLLPDRSGMVFPFSFPRDVVDGAWAGAVPGVTISPNGFTEPDGEPAVTVPPPA